MLAVIKVAAGLLCALLITAAAPAPQVAAHPVVFGAAGPYSRVEIILTRPAEPPAGKFSGIARSGNRRIVLPGNPDEPEGFFYLEPTAVLFTPVDRTRRNGIVILYLSSRIGPGQGTDHRALVYGLERSKAVRLPALEEVLEGTRDAKTARRRIRAALAR